MDYDLQKLSQKEIHRLKTMREWSYAVPTIWSMIRPSARILILRLILGLALTTLIWWLEFTMLILFALGILVGATIRDMVWFRQSARGWPLLSHIIDWSKVDKLLQENDEY